MDSPTDEQLLRRYVESRDQGAFAQIVERHIHAVYAAAKRQVRDPHTAEDVTQAVFIVLARRADSIRNPQVLPGYLLKVTWYTARDARKARARQSRLEQEAASMLNPTPEPVQDPAQTWRDIAPVLDDALGRLSAMDRTAIMLRYLEGRPVTQVAAALGTSEPAAAKRVTRALAKLRHLLSRRGVTVPAALLAATLTAHSLEAAPAMLSAAALQAAHSAVGSSAAYSTTATTLAKGTLMAMTNAKIAGVAAAAILLLAIPVSYFALNWSPSAPVPAIAPPTTIAETAPTPETPAAEAPPAYGLKPDQFIAHIAPPFPDARAALIASLNARGGASNQQDPLAMIIGWDNDKPSARRFGQMWGKRGGYTVTMLAQTVLGLLPYEVEGDPAILNKTLPGDFVISVNASQDQLLAGLEKMLITELGQPVSLQFGDVSTDTYILRGQWNYHPMASAQNAASPQINLYGDPNAAVVGTGSGIQSSLNLDRTLARYLGAPVIIDATGLPPRIGYQWTNYAAADKPEPSLVLDHVASQTGLTWSKESRLTKRLFVEIKAIP